MGPLASAAKHGVPDLVVLFDGMELSNTDIAKVELAASGAIDALLLTAFSEETVDVDGVWGEMRKSAGVEPAVAHYVVTVLLQAESNAVAAVEGAGATLILQRIFRAIKRVKERRPDAQAEVSVVRDAEARKKRLFNYVMPEDSDELQLALEALPEDMARSTPPVEKWWRHEHGWITAEEGWRLDGYTE